MNHRISYLMAASLALAVYPHLSLSASPQPTVAEVDILVDGALSDGTRTTGAYIEASKVGGICHSAPQSFRSPCRCWRCRSMA